ncbi:putative asparagine synthase [Mycena galericulata]|nr:putative asparagine synthase [Mycena galericulata]
MARWLHAVGDVMCGISALYYSDYYSDSATLPSSSNVDALLEASLINIQHRGPDYTGTWVAPDARDSVMSDSIIDLETGQRPLSDEGGLIHCIVAGQIYDHERIRGEPEAKGSVFKTKSDSELVVHLYKNDSFNFLSSLRGEFAFVLYDSTCRLLCAARDRFGIKPLYYTRDESILPFGWKVEWDIDSVVHNGDFSDDRTVSKGVNKAVIPSDCVCGPMYLLVSPSGEIDSAAVAGMAISLLREEDPNAKLATSTLAFPEAGDIDEGPNASRTVAFLGAEEHVVKVTEGDLVNALEEAIYHGEQPIISSLLAAGKFLLSKFVHDKGYKVVLSGEGTDEFFGGYAWLPVEYLRQPDPAGVALGLDLPSDEERQLILNRIQMATRCSNRAEDAWGHQRTPRVRGGCASRCGRLQRRRLGGVTGDPDVTSAIAEGIDARVREKAVSAALLLLAPSVKIRPFKGENQQWMFTEKWILRQAVKPYVTEELFLRKKLSYNAPPSRRGARDSSPVPLQEHLKARTTQPNVERVGFFEWPFVKDSLTPYSEHPEFPADGSLDVRAQLLLYVLSFIVRQERFHVPTWFL